MGLPSGTVTFLFTDIEGSTRLWEEQPDSMRLALARHDSLIRSAIESCSGTVFKTMGDAFFSVFSSASQAVEAAVLCQRSLLSSEFAATKKSLGLKVRIGIHTGESERRGDDYFGPPLNRLSRLLAAGHGGQILLTDCASTLVRDYLPPLASLKCLGEHRLKDLGRAESVYQLCHPEIESEFPALKSLEFLPNNLPIQLTSFIGRERELEEVARLFEKTRLVTLTGSGGCGKTRMALQAAAELLDGSGDGVWLVELAALSDPALVPQTVGAVLGLKEEPGKSSLQTLTEHFKSKRLLLLLDNCEHLLGACARLADSLLTQCPRVLILSTSREALGVSGEAAYRIPSLSLPERDSTPESLAKYESAQLFLERANLVNPGFGVTPQNASSIASICRRLDGIPLAIELAASRIRTLSVDEVNQRLNQRFRLLTGASRTAVPRQQTLRSLIDWSYELLNDVERTLFCRLSVFSGGWTLEAAEQVCSGEPVGSCDVLDLLTSLTDKSLVVVDTAGSSSRFRLLETLREYAADRLSESREDAQLRESHAAYFERFAETRFENRFRHEKQCLDELEREHDNIRAALELLAGVGPRRALRLAGHMGWFWHLRSHYSEGISRLTHALSAWPARDEVRAQGLASAGAISAWAGDLDSAAPALLDSISIWRDIGCDQGTALALHDLGWGYFNKGDDAAARGCMEQSLQIQEEIGDPFLLNRARIGLLQVLVSMEELEIVEPMAEQALVAARELSDLRSEHFAFHFLADCPLIRGDAAAAMGRYRRALELAVALGDRAETAVELQGIAMSAAGVGDPHRALKLAGAADAEFEALRIDLSGIRFWSDLLKRYLEPAREELAEPAAGAAWQQGRAMTLDQAVEYALSGPE